MSNQYLQSIDPQKQDNRKPRSTKDLTSRVSDAPHTTDLAGVRTRFSTLEAELCAIEANLRDLLSKQ
jgi:hypothetical protein